MTREPNDSMWPGYETMQGPKVEYSLEYVPPKTVMGAPSKKERGSILKRVAKIKAEEEYYRNTRSIGYYEDVDDARRWRRERKQERKESKLQRWREKQLTPRPCSD